jgi:hypothetical protein
MPKTQREPLELSRDELREVSVALADQIATLTRLDAAVYARHIEHAYSALAKVLMRRGQKPGDKCFLCREPLVQLSDLRSLVCSNGCESPATYLRRVAE